MVQDQEVKFMVASAAVSQGHSDSAVEQELDFSQATNPARWWSDSPGAKRQLTLGPSPPFFGGGPYLGPANGMRFGLVRPAQPLKHRMGQPQSNER
jgi:hypothetical protein